MKHKPIENSVPGLVANIAPQKCVDDSERLRVRIVLKPAELDEAHPTRRKIELMAAALPRDRERLGGEDVRALAPSQESFARVTAFAEEYHLDVIDVSTLRHDVVLEATVAALNKAFNIRLEHYEHGGRHFHAHQQPVHLPDGLDEIVVGVLGLNNVPLAASSQPAMQSGVTPVTPLQLKEYYEFPDATGKGQKIACIGFSSDEDPAGYHSKDIENFFEQLGLDSPRINEISVSDYQNTPLDRDKLSRFIVAMNNPGATVDCLGEEFGQDVLHALGTIELTMDIELLGAMAPDAEIIVLFADNSLDGLVEAISKAFELDATAVSVSWGNNEANWNVNPTEAANHIFKVVAGYGSDAPTICCASGDWGSPGMPNDAGKLPTTANAFFPASSPYVLAVGGTVFQECGGHLQGEAVWNSVFLKQRGASGGGISGVFKRHACQEDRGLPSITTEEKYWLGQKEEPFAGRGVPDVAAVADRDTGIELCIGGETVLSSGTSAAAPIWAGLLACVAEKTGSRLGCINTLLYSKEFAPAFREITVGNNNISDDVPYFEAGVGWNGCCGLGSPRGELLAGKLSGDH